MKTVKEIKAKMETFKQDTLKKYFGKSVPAGNAEADLIEWTLLEEELKLAENGWKAEFPVLVNRRTGKEAQAKLRYNSKGRYWSIKTIAGSETHCDLHGKNTTLYNAGYEVRKLMKRANAVRSLNETGKRHIKIVRCS